MSHIVIDARIINSSTGRYVERLLNQLEKIDTENTYTILVPPKDLDYYQPRNKNFSITTVDFDNYSLSEQFGFKKILENLKPDLVHFMMPQQPVFYKGKTVTTFHDLTLLKTYNSDKNWLSYRFKQMVGRWVFKKVAKKSDQLIAVSEFTKSDVVQTLHANPKKITVTYEAGDITSTSTKKPALPFSEFILYVGQQSDYKNIKRLGEAHQKLLKTKPDLGLVLAGKLNASAIKNQAYFESKKYKNIHFTDFVSDEELNWLYQNCAAYVFPSTMEGFGLPGLEAMARGAPVVSSNATCLPEIYGEAAHYFNPLDTDDMATKISQVLDDSVLRQKLISNGSKQIKKYSWQKTAEQTLEVYKKAISSR